MQPIVQISPGATPWVTVMWKFPFEMLDGVKQRRVARLLRLRGHRAKLQTSTRRGYRMVYINVYHVDARPNDSRLRVQKAKQALRHTLHLSIQTLDRLIERETLKKVV